MTLDISIFVIFLGANLVVGLWKSREIKTIQDFALGGRSFTTAALVSTIVATWASGSGLLINLSKTYSNGLYFLLPILSMCGSLFLTAYVLIPRMGEFMGNLSVAEAMGSIYGKEVRIITAICGILGTVGSIAVQFKAFGGIFNYFFGLDSTYALVSAGLIVTLYSSFGGIRAVTNTDVLQFFTFGFAIPMIGIVIWYSLSDSVLSLEFLLNNKEFNSKFNIFKIINFGDKHFLEMIPLMLYFAIPAVGTTSFQRISMAKDLAQAKSAWNSSAIILFFILLASGWIPTLINIINPNLEADKLIYFIADNYTYAGLKGLVMIGVVSLAMSTADSQINATSVLFVNDICSFFGVTDNKLIIVKLFSLAIGIFSIFLALINTDLLSIILSSASFYMPVVSVPLLMMIMGFRSSKISVLIGMGAGITMVLYCNILNPSAYSIIKAMITNLVFLLASHYVLGQTGGWVGVKDTKFLEQAKNNLWRKKIVFLTNLKEFNIVEYLKKSSPKDEMTYSWLGIYFIIYTMTTMYSTRLQLTNDHSKLIMICYQIMIVTGVVMAMYPIWPRKIKYEIIVQIAWNIVIFYMLIFFSSFFVMVSKFGLLQFGVFVLNILVAAILMGWRLGGGLTLLGFYISTLCYKKYANIDYIDNGFDSTNFLLIYTLMLLGTVLIVFFRPKQYDHELTKDKNEHLLDQYQLQAKEIEEALELKSEFLRNISHEYHTPMTGIISTAEVLNFSYEKLSEKQKRDAISNIYKSSLRLDAFENNINILSKISKGKLELKLSKRDFSEFIVNRLDRCLKTHGSANDEFEILFDLAKKVYCKIDANYMAKVIDNLILNSIEFCRKGVINLKLRTTESKIIFTISDEGIGIPMDELVNIFDQFKVGSKTKTPAGGRGIGLSVAKKIIELHGGEIRAESNGVKGAQFIIELPII